MRIRSRIVYAAFLCLILAGILSCEHNSSKSPTVTPDASAEPKDGFLIDAPATGVYYQTSPSGLSGVTGKSGNFKYQAGDTIVFSVANHQIGYAVTADRCISPLNLARSTTVYGSRDEARLAQNIIRFFMAMDTATNPYGITLPATTGVWNGDLMSILTSATFDSDIVAAVAALRQIEASAVVIPSVSDAQNHFLISEALIKKVNDKTTDNLYASIRLPLDFKNHHLDVAYNADQYPEGLNSYNSGMKVAINNDGIASFSDSLHVANWQLTLATLKNDSKITVNDIICFYTENGFSAIPGSGYPLEMNADSELIHADLTDSSNFGLVTSVHTLSGTIIVPKRFPDSSELTAASFLDLKLFVDILDSECNRAGSIMLLLPVPNRANWTNSGDNWGIPFSTSLADGYDYRLQLYWKPVTGKQWLVKGTETMAEPFSTDVQNMNFSFASWDD